MEWSRDGGTDFIAAIFEHFLLFSVFLRGEMKSNYWCGVNIVFCVLYANSWVFRQGF